MNATAEQAPFTMWVSRHSHVLHRISLAAILCSALAITWAMPLAAMVESLRSWSEESRFWGALVYAMTYILLTLCCLPVWLMPFVAGAIFGPGWGTGISSACCVVAASVTFLASRALGRTSLRSFLERSPRMRALGKTVDAGDWKVVAAVRLSHFLPFGMQNYAFGLTRIGFLTFLFTTWLITLPGTAFQVYLGHLGFTSVEAWQQQSLQNWQTWGMRLVGLAVFASAVGYLAFLGRSVYRTVVKQELERQLRAEAAVAENQPQWPGDIILLFAFATAFTVVAIGSVIKRDALRDSLHQILPAQKAAYREATGL